MSTFTEKIRTAALNLSLSEERRFTTAQLSNEAGIQSYSENRSMFGALRELVKTGEVKRLSRGVYQYVGVPIREPQKQEVMWRILRMRRTVTVEDLRTMADASESYAQEWLRVLIRNGVVRDHGNGNFQLIQDPVEMPVNTKKAERLRSLRKRQRKALDIVDKALAVLGEVRTVLEEMGEGCIQDKKKSRIENKKNEGVCLPECLNSD